LTAEGEQLLAHIRPFFEDLEAVASQLRKGSSPLIRAVLEESQRYIPKSWPEWQCKDKGLPI
jgi:DNA-binding transcriptional LysR family regulator